MKPKAFKFSFGDKEETIETRGYKKAVKNFQAKNSQVKVVAVEWIKNDQVINKIQKLPLGRKKKIGR